MTYSEILNKIVNQIIDWSDENTAGLVISRDNIRKTVISIINKRNLQLEFINNVMGENESERGFLVKASDFREVISEYKEDIDEEDDL